MKTLKCTTRNSFGKEKWVLSGTPVGCSSNAINTVILVSCIKYVLEHIQSSRKEIIADLLKEIQIMQQKDEPIDTSKLEAEIENFSRKKKKAIDLMLDDLITKKDLQEQTAFYDSEIERLNLEIHNGRNSNAVYDKQVKEIKKCIEGVEKATSLQNVDTEMFGELLKKFVVHQNCVMDVYLNCVPFGFRLTYCTKQNNRYKEYACIVDSLQIID